MKSGDAIRIKWQKEYWLLHGLRTIPYKLDTAPGVLDAWFKGRQN